MDNLKKLTEEIKSQMLEKLSAKEFADSISSTKANADNGTFKVVISTEDQDRQGEVILQSGWDFTNYKANPVVLWGHDYYSLPIGITDNIYVEGKQTIAEGRFASHPFAQLVRGAYDEGMQPATSVGFIAKEMEGNVITKAELLEFSFVSVPANPNVRDLAKKLGLNMQEMVTKGFFKEEVKTQDVEEKGAVADELNKEEIMDMKYERCDEVWDIISAFFSIYLDDNTPVDNFGELLTETAQLLTALASNPAEEITTESKIYTSRKSFIKNSVKEILDTTEKSGRVISEKNKAVIQSALDGMKNASAALDELLVSSESGDGKILNEEIKEDKTFVGHELDAKEIAKIAMNSKKVLQLIAHVTSESLANIKKHNLK